MNEQAFKKHFAEQLLNVLLDKYERSKAFRTGEPTVQRPQTTLTARPFGKDYLDEMDFRKREWMLEVMSELAAAGVLDLKWRRFEEGRDVEKVYLPWDGIEEAYQLARRKPKLKQFEEMMAVLEPLTRHPWEWVREWALTAIEQLSSRQSGGLKVEEAEKYMDLVKVLEELPQQSGTIQKRMFSRRLFGDSKHFETEVQARLVHLLRYHADIERNTDEEYLETIGIQSHPKPVLIKGDARLATKGVEWELSVYADGIGLYPETIRHLSWIALPVERIVLIENLSSFHQWVRVRSDYPELVIYTEGFPHRSLQHFLQSLFAFRNRCGHTPSVFHWGDIDLGGIRIFEYIRSRYCQDLQPLFMDETVLKQYGAPVSGWTAEYESSLQDMLVSRKYAVWKDVITCIREHQMLLEQESIPDEMVKLWQPKT